MKNDHAPGYGPKMVQQAPENDVYRALVAGGLTKRQQGYVIGLFRRHNLVYNPRNAPPRSVRPEHIERARMYLLHQLRSRRDLGDRVRMSEHFRNVYLRDVHRADGPYPKHMLQAIYYAAMRLAHWAAELETRYHQAYEAEEMRNYFGGVAHALAWEHKVLRNEINQHYYETRAARE